MEVSEVRKRVLETIERARRGAAEKRGRVDEASRAYELFLNRTAVPMFRQISMALKAEGLPFTVITPGGSVRLTSDRSGDDYIELSLETGGDHPAVIAHVSRARGRRVLEFEELIGGAAIDEITEEELLWSVMKALEPL